MKSESSKNRIIRLFLCPPLMSRACRSRPLILSSRPVPLWQNSADAAPECSAAAEGSASIGSR
jgi:hypothetical protein